SWLTYNAGLLRAATAGAGVAGLAGCMGLSPGLAGGSTLAPTLSGVVFFFSGGGSVAIGSLVLVVDFAGAGVGASRSGGGGASMFGLVTAATSVSAFFSSG